VHGELLQRSEQSGLRTRCAVRRDLFIKDTYMAKNAKNKVLKLVIKIKFGKKFKID
jgi:hypothetical protein